MRVWVNVRIGVKGRVGINPGVGRSKDGLFCSMGFGSVVEWGLAVLRVVPCSKNGVDTMRMM